MGQVINMSEWRANNTQEESQPQPALTESEIERLDLRVKLRYCLLRLWTLQEPDLTKDNLREEHLAWYKRLIDWVYSEEEPSGKREL